MNEQLQLHLIRLALRELSGRAYPKDISDWIGNEYARMRVGVKKTKYLLNTCEDISHKTNKNNDTLYWYNKPKMRISDAIRIGLMRFGSMDELAKAMNVGKSKLSQWMKKSTNPSEDGLKIIDEFVERYDLWKDVKG